MAWYRFMPLFSGNTRVHKQVNSLSKPVLSSISQGLDQDPPNPHSFGSRPKDQMYWTPRRHDLGVRRMYMGLSNSSYSAQMLTNMDRVTGLSYNHVIGICHGSPSGKTDAYQQKLYKCFSSPGHLQARSGCGFPHPPSPTSAVIAWSGGALIQADVWVPGLTFKIES